MIEGEFPDSLLVPCLATIAIWLTFDILADEILVNAADNFQRDQTMDRLEVTIDAAAGRISVWNNGRGIPIEIHKEHNCYVPELIFGKYPTLFDAI